MTSSPKLKPFLSNTGVLRAGLLMGLVGGGAEVAVISAYAAATGGDAGLVARGVSSAVGMDGGSALSGVAVHMGISLALGVALAALMQTRIGRKLPANAAFPVMMGALAGIWLVNFFIVLPVVSPAFVHLLPFAVTLGSKLAFGLSAAVAAHLMTTRSATQPRSVLALPIQS